MQQQFFKTMNEPPLPSKLKQLPRAFQLGSKNNSNPNNSAGHFQLTDLEAQLIKSKLPTDFFLINTNTDELLKKREQVRTAFLKAQSALHKMQSLKQKKSQKKMQQKNKNTSHNWSTKIQNKQSSQIFQNQKQKKIKKQINLKKRSSLRNTQLKFPPMQNDIEEIPQQFQVAQSNKLSKQGVDNKKIHKQNQNEIILKLKQKTKEKNQKKDFKQLNKELFVNQKSSLIGSYSQNFIGNDFVTHEKQAMNPGQIVHSFPVLPTGLQRFIPTVAVKYQEGQLQTNNLRYLFGLNYNQPMQQNIPHLNQKQKNFCLNLVHKLKCHRSSQAFRIPVDPEGQGVPDYFYVIYNPMDLSTIQRKVIKDKYRFISEFHSDINLIFLNSYKYNLRQTKYFQATVQFEDYYQSLIKEAFEKPQQYSQNNQKVTKMKTDSGYLDYTQQTPIKKKKKVNNNEKLYNVNLTKTQILQKNLKKIRKSKVYGEDHSVGLHSQSMGLDTINDLNQNNLIQTQNQKEKLRTPSFLANINKEQIILHQEPKLYKNQSFDAQQQQPQALCHSQIKQQANSKQDQNNSQSQTVKSQNKKSSKQPMSLKHHKISRNSHGIKKKKQTSNNQSEDDEYNLLWQNKYRQEMLRQKRLKQKYKQKQTVNLSANQKIGFQQQQPLKQEQKAHYKGQQFLQRRKEQSEQKNSNIIAGQQGIKNYDDKGNAYLRSPYIHPFYHPMYNYRHNYYHYDHQQPEGGREKLVHSQNLQQNNYPMNMPEYMVGEPGIQMGVYQNYQNLEMRANWKNMPAYYHQNHHRVVNQKIYRQGSQNDQLMDEEQISQAVQEGHDEQNQLRNTPKSLVNKINKRRIKRFNPLHNNAEFKSGQKSYQIVNQIEQQNVPNNPVKKATSVANASFKAQYSAVQDKMKGINKQIEQTKNSSIYTHNLNLYGANFEQESITVNNLNTYPKYNYRTMYQPSNPNLIRHGPPHPSLEPDLYPSQINNHYHTYPGKSPNYEANNWAMGPYSHMYPPMHLHPQVYSNPEQSLGNPHINKIDAMIQHAQPPNSLTTSTGVTSVNPKNKQQITIQKPHQNYANNTEVQEDEKKNINQMEELNGNANDNQTMNLQKIVKKKSKAIKTKKVDKSYSSQDDQNGRKQKQKKVNKGKPKIANKPKQNVETKRRSRQGKNKEQSMDNLKQIQNPNHLQNENVEFQNRSLSIDENNSVNCKIGQMEMDPKKIFIESQIQNDQLNNMSGINIEDLMQSN